MGSGRQYVLWGSSGHAKVLADAIGLCAGSVEALFDNSASASSVLPGVPLYPGSEFEAWARSLPPSHNLSAAVAIGGSRGADRRDLVQRLEAAGLQLTPVIHPTAIVSASAYIAAGCQVLAGAVIAAGTVLGVASIVNNSANIDHECEIGSGVHIAPGAVLCGCVRVGMDAFIGAGATVLPRLTIGERAIVGAGAVVTRDVYPDAVMVGNPARTEV